MARQSGHKSHWRNVLGLTAVLLMSAHTAWSQEWDQRVSARRGERPRSMQPAIEYTAPAPVTPVAVHVQEYGFKPRHENEATRGEMNPSGGNAPELFDGEQDAGALPMGEGGWDEGPMYDSPYNWALVDPYVIWRRQAWEISTGAQGFTGPVNQGSGGSFGFHEAVNFGSTLPFWGCQDIGWQVGARATQSNFTGSAITPDTRHQAFATLGLFHRVDRGLQWGFGIDWLHDSWYSQIDVRQVRGEMSWKATCWHELGMMFATGNDTQTVTYTPQPLGTTSITSSYTTVDWYALFVRRRFGECENGETRLYGGFTGNGDGLVGADVRTPLFGDWALQGAFTCLFPKTDTPTGQNASYATEVWNVGMSIVWAPGIGKPNGYYRPLLNVADNGSLMLAHP